MKELSHTSDDRMTSIVATIQRDQNAIIRNEDAEALIIQGVAGSGKTSIALHRIAFLLYRGDVNQSLTRAMHDLVVTHTGTRTPFIADEARFEDDGRGSGVPLEQQRERRA
jgi:hypothetical protein